MGLPGEHPRRAGRAAIVLAAGGSRRMGAPKALLPWAGTTLVGYAVHALHAAGASPIIVVVGADAEEISAAVPVLEPGALRVVRNSEYLAGRSSSIRHGASAVPDERSAVIVQSVDQPCLPTIAIRLYAALEASGLDVAVPVFGGRRGHPVCFAGALLPELRAVAEEGYGLRAVVRGHFSRTVEVQVPSETIHLNLNDEAGYRAAVARQPWKLA